ncbi:MAG: SDR family NAD(P)-dependent oxidoreductase [Ahrensia sp.]|nr:SDR family NAD(P)-dependent oxidoreductase [Ahrensia sp.]
MSETQHQPLRIVITGASDGLGYHLARNYAAHGHDVLTTGSRQINDERLYFDQAGIAYVRADQSEPQRAAGRIDEALDRLGWDRLDLVLLNAGVGWSGDPAEEKPDSVAWQVAVNLGAPVAIAHRLSSRLFAAEGKLVLIGSTAAASGNARFATYAATKAALDAFARALREEWAGRAQVLMLHPGPIRTDMHAKAGLKLGLVRRFFMTPERVARAVAMAVRKGEAKRMITRAYGWRSLLSRPREGQL